MLNRVDSSPSFKSINITTVSKSGKKIVQNFQTTKFQEKLIKDMADGMAKDGYMCTKISNENANKFHRLLEIITGKPFKKGTQQKLMSNIGNDYITFGDMHPEKSGMIAVVKFTK